MKILTRVLAAVIVSLAISASPAFAAPLLSPSGGGITTPQVWQLFNNQYIKPTNPLWTIGTPLSPVGMIYALGCTGCGGGAVTSTLQDITNNGNVTTKAITFAGGTSTAQLNGTTLDASNSIKADYVYSHSGGNINIEPDITRQSGPVVVNDDFYVNNGVGHILSTGSSSTGEGFIGVNTSTYDILGSGAQPAFNLFIQGTAGPAVDNVYQLGSASKRWSELYAGTVTSSAIYENGKKVCKADGTDCLVTPIPTLQQVTTAGSSTNVSINVNGLTATGTIKVLSGGWFQGSGAFTQQSSVGLGGFASLFQNNAFNSGYVIDANQGAGGSGNAIIIAESPNTQNNAIEMKNASGTSYLGTGSTNPEGARVATPGSVLFTTGGIAYIKQTGVGSTGWVQFATGTGAGVTPSLQSVTAVGNATTLPIVFAGGTSTGDFIDSGSISVSGSAIIYGGLLQYSPAFYLSSLNATGPAFLNGGTIFSAGTSTGDFAVGGKLAVGVGAKATGFNSVAMGNSASSTGANSIAMGNNAIASGSNSLAFGPGSQAKGFGSEAFNAAIVSGINSNGFGADFALTGSNSFGFNMDTGSFVTSTQDNSFTITGGNVGIGTVTPAYLLDAAGTIQAITVSTTNITVNYKQVCLADGTNCAADSSTLQSVYNANPNATTTIGTAFNIATPINPSHPVLGDNDAIVVRGTDDSPTNSSGDGVSIGKAHTVTADISYVRLGNLVALGGTTGTYSGFNFIDTPTIKEGQMAFIDNTYPARTRSSVTVAGTGITLQTVTGTIQSISQDVTTMEAGNSNDNGAMAAFNLDSNDVGGNIPVLSLNNLGAGSAATVSVGTGTPDNYVPVNQSMGSIGLDTDGGTGTTMYIKTGPNDTDWQGVVTVPMLPAVTTSQANNSISIGYGAFDQALAYPLNILIGHNVSSTTLGGIGNTIIGSQQFTNSPSIGGTTVALGVGQGTNFSGTNGGNVFIGALNMTGLGISGDGNTFIGRQIQMAADNSSASNTIAIGHSLSLADATDHSVYIGEGLIGNGAYELNIGDAITGDLTPGFTAINIPGIFTVGGVLTCLQDGTNCPAGSSGWQLGPTPSATSGSMIATGDNIPVNIGSTTLFNTPLYLRAGDAVASPPADASPIIIQAGSAGGAGTTSDGGSVNISGGQGSDTSVDPNKSGGSVNIAGGDAGASLGAPFPTYGGDITIYAGNPNGVNSTPGAVRTKYDLVTDNSGSLGTSAKPWANLVTNYVSSSAMHFVSSTGTNLSVTNATSTGWLGFASASGTTLNAESIFINGQPVTTTPYSLAQITASGGNYTGDALYFGGGAISAGLAPASGMSNVLDLGASNNIFRKLYINVVSSTGVTALNVTTTNITFGTASASSVIINGSAACTANGTNCPDRSLQTVTGIGKTTTLDIQFAGGTSTANFKPSADNTLDLGTLALHWREGYFGTVSSTNLIASATSTLSGTVIHGGGFIEHYVNVSTNYTALQSDMSIGVSSTGAVLVTLPPNAVAGTTYKVKDERGTAAANNITVSSTGAVKVDGAANFVMNSNYAANEFYSNGQNWFVR